MHVNRKRGQLSYEYVIIAGTLLVVLIPFFYYSFELMHSQLNDYYGGGAVNTIADLTKTASNLFRGSTIEAVIRLPKDLEEISSVGGKHVTLKFSNGEDINALGGGYSRFGAPSLEGGPRTVSVTKIVGSVMTISFGGPVIACLTKVNRAISEKSCINQAEGKEILNIKPSEELMIVGSGMSGNTNVRLQKFEQQQQWGDFYTHDNAVVFIPGNADEAPLGDVMQFAEPTYGSGNYRVSVEEMNFVSNYAYFSVGGKGEDDDSD